MRCFCMASLFASTNLYIRYFVKQANSKMTEQSKGIANVEQSCTEALWQGADAEPKYIL